MYELRTTTDADLPTLYGIHRSAMFGYVNSVWGWDEADQQQRFRDYVRSARLQVITVDSQEVGFLDVVKNEDNLYVSNIELAPAYQGKGLGTAIMEDLIAQARHESLPVKLQVLKINQGAKRLYQRLGFDVQDETATHYLMKLEATADSPSRIGK